MTTYDLTIIILVMECVLYFLIAAVALKRSDLQERATRALILYAAVSCLWCWARFPGDWAGLTF